MKKKRILSRVYSFVSRFIHEGWAFLFPQTYAKYFYKKTSNHRLDLKDPRDYNEKIEWLKIHADTSLWTECADKYKVRDYISRSGLSHILSKLYGVWSDPDEIDFNNLPNEFVFKANHGFGKTILVRDKRSLDMSEIK